MKSSRHTKKNRAVLLFSFLLIWGLCPDVRAEEAAWKEYRTTAAEGTLSYDPKSVAAEDSVVEVWSKFEPAADERIREMKHWVRFDCARKRMRLLKTITTYRDGSVVELPQKNKFEAIEPGSNPAVLGALVCGETYEPQESVTAPIEKPLTESQAPVPQQPQQNALPAETTPAAPANLPQ